MNIGIILAGVREQGWGYGRQTQAVYRCLWGLA